MNFNNVCIDRRRFLVIAACSPLLAFPVRSDAFFQGLVFRFFARKVLNLVSKKIVKKAARGVKISNVPTNVRLNASSYSIKSKGKIDDIIDELDRLAKIYNISKTVMDIHEEYFGTVVVGNNGSKAIKIPETIVVISDKNSQKVPIVIPELELAGNDAYALEFGYKGLVGENNIHVYQGSASRLLDSVLVEEVLPKRQAENTKSDVNGGRASEICTSVLGAEC